MTDQARQLGDDEHKDDATLPALTKHLAGDTADDSTLKAQAVPKQGEIDSDDMQDDGYAAEHKQEAVAEAKLSSCAGTEGPTSSTAAFQGHKIGEGVAKEKEEGKDDQITQARLRKDKNSDKDREVGAENDNEDEEEEEEGEKSEEGEEDEDEEEDEEEEEDEDEDDEDEEEDEPRLKYARLTPQLNSIYRNGDATSAFLVAGDKMIVGTHNGVIHVLQLPTFQVLRVYQAHSASVTSISISPYPPPTSTEPISAPIRPSGQPESPRPKDMSPAAASRKRKEPVQLPRIPSNDIHIATASMDGNVCVQSLLDIKDVQLRNFARPVQAVALSPDFKTDRTYISGGLGGQLIVTAGGGPGRSTSTTIGTAAATASGWLGSMGLGANTGKDTVIHSGEGTVGTITWSLSGKYVVWLNEHGIKIMRSKLHLESHDVDNAWKRIGHIDRPQTDEWETMASVWKGRTEWIDESALENDELGNTEQSGIISAGDRSKGPASVVKKNVERLLVGWGGTIWIIHVHPGRVGASGEQSAGRAEIVKILRMDCIISGLSLYTPNTLLVLAFCPPDDDDGEKDEGDVSNLSASPGGSKPSGGVRKRQNNLPPELRLIDLASRAEIDKESLSMSRYERLFAADYHLSILPARTAASAVAARGAFETIAGLGTDFLNVAINPKALFSSGASIRSRDSTEDVGSNSRSSIGGTMRSGSAKPGLPPVHPSMAKPGAKVFIHSPYDCILATKRDLSDHLYWLLEHEQYSLAWELLDDNPDILADRHPEQGHPAGSAQGGIEHFFEDESLADSTTRDAQTAVEREKQRIGELWIKELIDEGNWSEAGEVCGRVLRMPDRWEKWVWTFANAKRFDEITGYIPSAPMDPPIPTTVYEVVLGHYIHSDKPRFRDLLDLWSTDLFDTKTVTTTLENQLKFRDVREDSIEDGEKGRDWRIVTESLAKLYEAGGRHREALKCFIKLQDADSAFRLIRDSHLAEAVADDIPSFIGLKVPSERMDKMTQKDLSDATADAITLLVDEAQHGLVGPKVVIEQLQAKQLRLYLFFYLRALWHGDGVKEHIGEHRDRLVLESRILLDDYADLAVNLFASNDRALLMHFLKTSTAYTFDKAVQECEQYEYYDELVYLYSKTGQMKRALYLIIDRLQDVQKAIEFVKEQDDPDLWENLLDYSMDKPSFIRALLEQIGTSINPITLVRRIPEGLEIQGLREGLTHMMKEHELQHSISNGAARVMQSEVAAKQNELRSGQRRGVKFQPATPPEVDDEAKADGARAEGGDEEAGKAIQKVPPGHCAGCREAFTEFETETLLGYACGHVFHVSHLLEMLHKGRKVDVDMDGSYGGSSRYSVGIKVMKARLLRDKVRGGCPICHTRQ